MNHWPTLRDIEDVALTLMDAPQVEMPVTNHFAPGVYGREFFVPAGTFVIGHIHKHAHLNVLLQGRMTVLVDGRAQELTAPMVFVSGPNVAKVAIVHEDMRFLTLHPLAGLEHCGQDVNKLVNEICDFTDAYKTKVEGRRSKELQEVAA